MSKSKKLKNIVAFDFDGVIYNTALESFTQAVKAGAEFGFVFPDKEKLKEKFLAGRNLVTQLGEYYTVLRLIKQHPGINFDKLTEAQFSEECKRDASFHKAFLDRFVAHRKEMQTTHPKEWAALQKQYKGAVNLFRRVSKRNLVYIATTKDLASVLALLKTMGLNVPRERILSKEFSGDKTKQLAEIEKRTGRKPLLIDDSIEQVARATEKVRRAVLAKWGYSTELQKKAAKERGYPILT
ncbi:MAG: HAD family hydrolase, partial [archaeon]